MCRGVVWIAFLVLFWLPRRGFEGIISLLLSHVLMMDCIFLFIHLFTLMDYYGS